MYCEGKVQKQGYNQNRKFPKPRPLLLPGAENFVLTPSHMYMSVQTPNKSDSQYLHAPQNVQTSKQHFSKKRGNQCLFTFFMLPFQNYNWNLIS